MEINVLDETKSIGNIGKKLFNLNEQLEVSNLQEQMKDYLNKNEKVIDNRKNTKEKNIQKPTQTVIEIRQEKAEVKKEKSKFLSSIASFTGEIVKDIALSKLFGKAVPYLQPVIKNLQEKISNIRQKYIKY